MHGDEVLAHHGHCEDARQHQPFRCGDGATLCFFVCDAQSPQDRICQKLGQSCAGYGHREGAKEGIAQCNLCAAGKAFLECHHRGIEAKAAKETTDKGSDEQRQHHMHPKQGEGQHDDDGNEDCVHAP